MKHLASLHCQPECLAELFLIRTRYLLFLWVCPGSSIPLHKPSCRHLKCHFSVAELQHNISSLSIQRSNRSLDTGRAHVKRLSSGVHAREVYAHEMHAFEIHAHEIHAMRYTLMRYTPMRHTPMRCTPVTYTPMGCMPVRCTFMRYTPMRCTPKGYIRSCLRDECRSRGPSPLCQESSEDSIIWQPTLPVYPAQTSPSWPC